MLMSLLLALLVSVTAFAGGFIFARRPTLPREVARRLRHGLRRASDRGRQACVRARTAIVAGRLRRPFERAVAVVDPARDRAATAGTLGKEVVAPPPADATGPGPAAPGRRRDVDADAPATAMPAPEGASVSPSALASALAPLATLGGFSSVRFEPIAPRGTPSADLALHSPEWRAAMAAVGERFAAAGVGAIVFVHGTFTGTDPLSAFGFVERALPSRIGPQLARSLRQKTRRYIRRVLGDLGNFGTAYVRLFEEAIRPRGARIPCTDFVWSSENHHVGRLEGALGLLRVLATHADLGAHRDDRARPLRILVIGHSHAGQLFALVTQLLARSMATDAILDVARARELDVAALETDVARLTGSSGARPRVAIDFVTFGAPNRYAWATVPTVRALHVIAVPSSGSRATEGDWIRRLGVEGSDFPPLSSEDRKINAALAGSLGHGGFAPTRVAAALRAGVGLPSNGEIAFVEYAERGLLATGLGHGTYTRLDGMLFHARLVADRFYPEASRDDGLGAEAAPLSARAWSALGMIGKPAKPARSRSVP